MHNISKNMVWKKFWKLFIIKVSHSDKYKHPILLCECDCWNEKLIRSQSIRTWNTVSCWCKRNYKHWLSRSRFYHIRQAIDQRCNNKKCDVYDNYWWRWIRCIWRKFEDFKNDMYENYLIHEKEHWTKDTTIERQDNDWGYCKSNCCWATHKEQSNNTRKTIPYYIKENSL